MSQQTKELEDEVEYLTRESEFLREELTKINNIIQPLWERLRELRTDFGRNPQTGKKS